MDQQQDSSSWGSQAFRFRLANGGSLPAKPKQPANCVNNHRRLVAIALTCLLTAAVGCGGVSDQPELGLVSGIVTLDEVPLSDVEVTFIPADGRPAMGKPMREACTS